MKRSCGTQCESTCDSAIQTKRLSKEEMRYYGKVIEKEKDVLLRFHDSKNHLQLPNNFLLDFVKTQLVEKHDGRKRKERKKNKRKFPTNKEKKETYEEDIENKAHYVSKILVDDSTKSLKISFKPCKQSYSTIHEKDGDETKTRKLKQPPRRYDHYEYELDSGLPCNISSTIDADENIQQCDVAIKLEPQNDNEDEKMHIQPSMISVYKSEYENVGDKWSSDDEKIEQKHQKMEKSSKIKRKNELNDEILGRNYIKAQNDDVSQVSEDTSSNEEESSLSDDEDSNCSEEFTILESTLKDDDDYEHDINNNTNEKNDSSVLKNEKSVKTTNESLPQVVSVHFFDEQNQCERIIDANTHVTAQYSGNNSQIRKQPITTTLPTIQPHHPSFTRASKPQATKTSTTNIPICSSDTPLFPFPRLPPKTTSGINSSIASNMIRSSVKSSGVSTLSETRIRSRKTTHEKHQSEHVSNHKPSSTSFHKRNDQEKERLESIKQRFIFGAEEKPRKRVISSLLTPLCEREATKLADGIHEINMQYFPLRSLAQKAAKKSSEETDDVMKLIEQKMELKTKIQDVDKARNLLKDIYDMVLKSKEIEDIQNFELVSHNFGVRNILNHLSLVDLYFGELGTQLESKL